MKLMTKAIEKKLPKLYSQENEKDPMVQVKYFCPWNHWIWYGIEFDGKDVFFGYVVGDYNELGYFHLSDLVGVDGKSGAKGPIGLSIERDLYFSPKRLSEVKADIQSAMDTFQKLSTEG